MSINRLFYSYVSQLYRDNPNYGKLSLKGKMMKQISSFISYPVVWLIVDRKITTLSENCVHQFYRERDILLKVCCDHESNENFYNRGKLESKHKKFNAKDSSNHQIQNPPVINPQILVQYPQRIVSFVGFSPKSLQFLVKLKI